MNLNMSELNERDVKNSELEGNWKPDLRLAVITGLSVCLALGIGYLIYKYLTVPTDPQTRDLKELLDKVEELVTELKRKV